MADQITHIGDTPRFSDVEGLANALMARFVSGEIASVHVAYMKFYSVGRQGPVAMPLLPLAQEQVEDAKTAGRAGRTEFEFSPQPEELLSELLPASVRIKLFQCFIDAAVSEQIARMVAMKAATDAADDMIKTLTRQYNRARQTQITMELLDIVGGANALA
jgi:F-type H+-transporting ATPase subunit gamma